MILVLFVHFFWKNLLDITLQALPGAFGIGTSQRKRVGTDVDLKPLHNTILMIPMPAPIQKARLALVQIDIAYFTHSLIFLHLGLVLLHVLLLFFLEFPGELLILLEFLDHVEVCAFLQGTLVLGVVALLFDFLAVKVLISLLDLFLV
jgi:hypothetical protein